MTRPVLGESLVRRVFWALVASEVVLLLLHVVLVFGFPAASRPLRRFVNVALSGNLPTWFSSVQLAAVGVLFLANAHFKSGRVGWWVLGLLFLALSIDENCELHEQLGDILTARAREGRLPHWLLDALGGLHKSGVFSWILYCGPILAISAILAVLWLRRALRKVPGAFTWACSGFAILAFSQLLEFFQGILEKKGWAVAVNVSMSAEEILEMFGATLLLSALLARVVLLAKSPQARGDM